LGLNLSLSIGKRGIEDLQNKRNIIKRSRELFCGMRKTTFEGRAKRGRKRKRSEVPLALIKRRTLSVISKKRGWVSTAPKGEIRKGGSRRKVHQNRKGAPSPEELTPRSRKNGNSRGVRKSPERRPGDKGAPSASHREENLRACSIIVTARKKA